MWVLDFVRELWLEKDSQLTFLLRPGCPRTDVLKVEHGLEKHCLQFNEIVYLACPLLKYQMTEVLFWLKDIFFFPS